MSAVLVIAGADSSGGAGLTLERLPGVFAAGADVAAVVTDIVRNPDPRVRARQWLAAAGAFAWSA